MKIKKLKFLSIAICCLVSALWLETQCMENPNRNDDEHTRNHQTEIVPAGSIMAFAGEKAPDGWLLCDGEQYSNHRYPKLYEVIQMKYVPDGSWIIEANKRSQIEKYFCVPDLKGRVIVGVDSGGLRVTSNNYLGASGGTENVTLTIDQMPKHSHKINLCTGSNNIHAGMSQWGGTFCDDPMIESTGGDNPHNNMQPYQVLNYIINTGEMNRGLSPKQEEKINQLEKQIEELKISQRGHAKAWVSFDGSATILDGYGVSSVIKHADGDFTVRFLKPFNSRNYCTSLSARGRNQTMIAASYCASPQTEESIRLITFNWGTNGACADPSFVSACFFGDQ